MKYSVGDIVYIKKSLIVYKSYNSVDFMPGMSRFLGKAATITQVRNGYYKINLDNGYWSWAEDMFDKDLKNRPKKATLSGSFSPDKILNIRQKLLDENINIVSDQEYYQAYLVPNYWEKIIFKSRLSAIANSDILIVFIDNSNICIDTYMELGYAYAMDKLVVIVNTSTDADSSALKKYSHKYFENFEDFKDFNFNF